ncbi:MAG: PDZ domain-containing protein [Acidobacteria bacterium]|nr:PDZ domain-containing protein [Acidobacteriota bacterium]
MNQSHPYRPRVSRETRLLLITAVVAVVALWGLARIRFPDRPAPPNPVQPLLTQLAARPTFDDLASEVAALRPRLDPLLIALRFVPTRQTAGDAGRSLTALRVGDDVAIVLLEAGAATLTTEHGEPPLARDPASGLALVRVPAASAPRPALWSPQQTQRPRYLMATDASTEIVSLRPVFIGSTQPTASPAWPAPLWGLPSQPDLVPGTFLFTSDAALAGLVIANNGRPALVPGQILLAETERLLARPRRPLGYVGITVQPLTAAVGRAAGASNGVVVTWVDPRGPAAGLLEPGEVIETAAGETLATPEHFEARMARLTAGQEVMLGVREGGELRQAALAAAAAPAAAPTGSPGFALRAAAGAGTEVVRVDPGSIAEKAGVAAGDIITRVGEVRSPTPAQVRRAFTTVADGRPVIVAFTRGETHHVTAVEK